MFGAKRIIRLSTYSSIFAFACSTDPRRVAGGRAQVNHVAGRVAGGRAQVNHVAAAGIGRRSARGAVLLCTRTPRALCFKEKPIFCDWSGFFTWAMTMVSLQASMTLRSSPSSSALPVPRGVA